MIYLAANSGFRHSLSLGSRPLRAQTIASIRDGAAPAKAVVNLDFVLLLELSAKACPRGTVYW